MAQLSCFSLSSFRPATLSEIVKLLKDTPVSHAYLILATFYSVGTTMPSLQIPMQSGVSPAQLKQARVLPLPTYHLWVQTLPYPTDLSPTCQASPNLSIVSLSLASVSIQLPSVFHLSSNLPADHAIRLKRPQFLSTTTLSSLAGLRSACRLQAGRTDLQDTTDVSAGVSEPPHLDTQAVTQQHAVTAIVISSITAGSFQTNVFRQTFLQHCSTICLELSVNICSEL